ncbi:MAG: NAD(P)H-dependent oxidoreductase subunit E, partial [Proteobacteria bacterium]|nr:NAD(P)H-dependent oxidoreductase subunit E [Pseudomonadota bacterium]
MLEKVNRILASYGNDRAFLIGILQDIQTEYNYLPPEPLERVAEKVDVPLSQVLSMATFFKAFSLKPRGKHLVTVCTGTACHVRGAPQVL